MKKSSLLAISALNALGVLIYTSAVAWIMFNAKNIFGDVTNFLGPLAMLLLFVFSATVVGALVLGRPAYLYLGGEKTEGIHLLLYTIGWLCLFVLAVFGILLTIR